MADKIKRQPPEIQIPVTKEDMVSMHDMLKELLPSQRTWIAGFTAGMAAANQQQAQSA